MKLLLFDLDGTLLKTDKTISERTLSALRDCKNKGYLIGISTSRSEQNCLAFLGELSPDILITSGGALAGKMIAFMVCPMMIGYLIYAYHKEKKADKNALVKNEKLLEVKIQWFYLLSTFKKELQMIDFIIFNCLWKI